VEMIREKFSARYKLSEGFLRGWGDFPQHKFSMGECSAGKTSIEGQEVRDKFSTESGFPSSFDEIIGK